MRKLIAVAACSVLLAGIPSTSIAAPCGKHPTTSVSKKTVTKAMCLKALKKQRARDRMKYPPNPNMRDLKLRVPDWWKFVKLGRCEQPSRSGRYGVNWKHHGPTWGGGLGIYKTSWNIAKSPYRLWSGSMEETILVADAIRNRYSIKSAWGAWRCFYA